jgi:hypothetical protein
MPAGRNERSSAIHVAAPWRGQWPRVENLPDAKDRAHAAFMYRGVVVMEHDITSTDVIHKPVNCVLAGEQPYKERGRTWDIPPARTTAKPIATGSSVRRMRGPAPTFTTRTGKRGYD